MAFIGNTNTTQAFTPAIDYFSGNGSTTAFTLSRPVASVAQVQVVVNNVAQNPSSAYTVSGNTITFTSAPLSGTNNIYVYYTSPITQVVALPQNPQVFGNLQFSSSGARITGDFSNATIASRVSFQDSTTNNGTYIQTLPNGTSQGSGIIVFNNSTTTNAAYMALTADATTAQVNSSITGTGTYLPMTFRTGGSERMRIDSSGNVGIGVTPSGSYKLQVNGQINGTSVSITGANSGAIYVQDSNTAFNPQIQFIGTNRTFQLGTGNSASGFNNQFFIYDGTAAATRMLIDSSGNLLFNSGYGSVATAYGCRAWVNFNGTGTVAIRASGNVSSITDNGTGDYTVNFTNAMPDVNYSIVGSSGSGNTYGSYAFNNPGAGSRFAVGSCRINSFITQSAGLADVDTVCVSVFR